MPSIVLGTDKISKKYQKLVTPMYLALQQNILEKIKNMRKSTECSVRLP
jgi:hypothetical protein